MESRPQHREVRSQKIRGSEAVRLFSCVDIMRRFLVVLRCVSSVCIFLSKLKDDFILYNFSMVSKKKNPLPVC